MIDVAIARPSRVESPVRLPCFAIPSPPRHGACSAGRAALTTSVGSLPADSSIIPGCPKLDVVLYRHDHHGRLVALGRKFRSLRSLTHFFGAEKSIPWEWAEVSQIDRDGKSRVVRYSGEDLRTPLDPPTPEPSEN